LGNLLEKTETDGANTRGDIEYAICQTYEGTGNKRERGSGSGVVTSETRRRSLEIDVRRGEKKRGQGKKQGEPSGCVGMHEIETALQSLNYNGGGWKFDAARLKRCKRTGPGTRFSGERAWRSSVGEGRAEERKTPLRGTGKSNIEPHNGKRGVCESDASTKN